MLLLLMIALSSESEGVPLVRPTTQLGWTLTPKYVPRVFITPET